MLKKELRSLYINKRKELNTWAVDAYSRAITELIINSFSPNVGNSMHLFLSSSKFNEVDTKHLVDYCHNNGVDVFVPKVQGGRMISVKLTPQSKLQTGAFGILEPQSNEEELRTHFDFIITPLLYADLNGNRVGYGKGYYDSFFGRLDSSSLRIGVSFFPPGDPISDLNLHDVALHYLVTPSEILSFKG